MVLLFLVNYIRYLPPELVNAAGSLGLFHRLRILKEPLMSFKKEIGGETFEIEPIAPYTQKEVECLIDSGETVSEHYQRHVIKKKEDDEAVAEYKIIADN